MRTYKKITYTISVILIFVVMLLLLVVHTFNHTSETGEETMESTTTKRVHYGD